MRSKRTLIVPAVILATAFCAFGGLDGSYVVPLDHPAIQYSKTPADDPISRLERGIAAGEVKLDYDPDLGYLPAVLRALKVPVSSQVLVFSKTSFQAPRISPRTPRALYFNDEVTIGYVRGGDVVEVTAADRRQGINFYTLDQEQASKPSFTRQEQCLQCHASGATLGVPGLVVRSVYPDRTGMPIFQAGSFITDHRSPMKQRWGGWYVTGTHGEQRHMGNTFLDGKDQPEAFDYAKGANTTDLTRSFDTGAYLAPDSDIVALTVLEHQTRMQNLITRVGYEARMAVYEQEGMNKALNEPPGTFSDSNKRRITSAAEELVRYMLFAGEAPLDGEIRGTSRFAEEYAGAGRRDKQGRSLRDLNLKTRVYKYPCSPLIYSPAFDGLPEMAKAHVYRRLWDVLSGSDNSREFAHLSPADRQAIREILIDTKSGLPEYWKL
jgi:hypothetical protein